MSDMVTPVVMRLVPAERPPTMLAVTICYGDEANRFLVPETVTYARLHAEAAAYVQGYSLALAPARAPAGFRMRYTTDEGVPITLRLAGGVGGQGAVRVRARVRVRVSVRVSVRVRGMVG